LLSLRLIRVTGKQLAWLLISAALLLMAGRRLLALFWFPVERVPEMAQLSNEFIAFATSLLMFVGILAIRPLFESIRDSRERLQQEVREREQAEAALRKSEQMLRTILSASPTAITHVEGGTVRWTNAAMLTMFGYSGETECLGRRARDFYSSTEEYERVLARFKKSLLSGAPFQTQARFRRQDGSFFHGEVQIGLLPNNHRETGLISSIMDVSERVRAQEELWVSEQKFKKLYEESKRQRELYRSLLDSSPDAVVIYDMEGRTQYVNDSFTRLFGWNLDELMGERIPFVPESEREASMATIQSLIQDGIPRSGFESKRYNKEGRILEVSLSASRYLDHAGDPAGMLVVLSDITQRRLLEEQLRQSAKMEAIGQLAGGLAHDFNNILTAVIGYANLLSNDLPQEGTYQERLAQITRASERAADLTRQLLAFSRKQVLDVRVTSLNGIIGDMDKLLKRLIGEHIELVTVLDEAAGMVQVDQVQIQQIVMNLAVNARDAMPDRGKLTIETSNAFLDDDYCRMHAEVRPGPYVMFAVSDAGQGMDSCTLARIFEPFFTTKEKGVGTGLGLATVYGIVKQHQGHISVYSEPGRGTTFKIYLPRIEALKDSPLPTWEPGSRPHGNETVLVVEDEEIVRKLACEALEVLGYRTLSAPDPRTAIEICSSHQGPIELLLTDVVLPQMDGRRLFEALSSVRPDLKVLYVSGYTENFIVHHGVLDKGLHFMQKPFNLNRLAGKVREILDAP
jgi:two-component system, cell cycle sensor histidine kinase and response regulator CckA